MNFSGHQTGIPCGQDKCLNHCALGVLNGTDIYNKAIAMIGKYIHNIKARQTIKEIEGDVRTSVNINIRHTAVNNIRIRRVEFISFQENIWRSSREHSPSLSLSLPPKRENEKVKALQLNSTSEGNAIYYAQGLGEGGHNTGRLQKQEKLSCVQRILMMLHNGRMFGSFYNFQFCLQVPSLRKFD